MTDVRLDPDSSTPPYEQVRLWFARRIGDGSLVTGTRLPTVRALAADLGIAVNTVARAYRELEEAGLVETRGRAGTVVAAAGQASRGHAARAARDYVDRVRALGIDDDEALALVRAALS